MFRKTTFVAAVLCCCIHGVQSFPLCMYGVNEPADVKTLKKAGFNCLQTYQTEPEKLAPLAQAARKQKMQTVFYPNKIIGSSYEEQARNWPMLAWYLVDEPDVNRWTRERVQETYNNTKHAFAHTPAALVIGQGKTATPFYDLPDILMVDWYPVPHLSLPSFGDNVRFAKEGQQKYGAAMRPLWGVVQTFDWKEFKQALPDNERIGRFPTRDEIRFMAYDAIINGAQGLFFFTFNHQKQPLPKIQPEWWARVANVTRELARLLPVLEKGERIKTPVALAFPLAAQTRLYKKHNYTFLINRSDKPVAAPQDFLTKTYKPLFGTVKTPQVPPYSVWVLKSKHK